jgi:hypothetical protein
MLGIPLDEWVGCSLIQSVLFTVIVIAQSTSTNHGLVCLYTVIQLGTLTGIHFL